MPNAEIIELHHDRQARRAERHGRAHRGADGRGERDATPPIHSVRLPGIVAHQEVILGDARRRR